MKRLLGLTRAAITGLLLATDPKIEPIEMLGMKNTWACR
jgi:hypothetical protein